MEVIQIAICILALLIVMFVPRLEKTGFFLLVVGWLFMIILYIGHTVHAVFGNINL